MIRKIITTILIATFLLSATDLPAFAAGRSALNSHLRVSGTAHRKDTLNGLMKALGKQETTTESFLDRHRDFEEDALNETAYSIEGTKTKFVEADLGEKVGEYYFESSSGEMIIVLNIRMDPRIQDEGKFHAIREIFWRTKGFTQSQAHIIAWAEQIKEFSKNGQPTKFQKYQLENMSEEELKKIISEKEAIRRTHHEILAEAIKKDAKINVDDVKKHEKKLRETAQVELKARSGTAMADTSFMARMENRVLGLPENIKIPNRYKLIEKIGSGGMGVVFRAKDTQTGEEVALKVMSNKAPQKEKGFEHEIAALKRLDHPSIVRLLSHGKENGTFYYVMELLDGASLEDILKKRTLTRKEVFRIGLQIASALTYIHEKGIAHRDIKPANIIIDKKGNAHIIDFGCATIDGENPLDKPDIVMGTLGYMSPEQMAGKETDERTDIYSLGVVLFEMIKGKCPFDGNSNEEIVKIFREKQVFEGQSRNILAENPENEDILRIALKALRRDPKDRQQSMKEVEESLAQLPYEQPIENAIAAPCVGSTEGYVNEAILLAEGQLRKGEITAKEAAKIIVDALKTMPEPEYLINIKTAIDILNAANDPELKPILEVLQKYSQLTNHAGLNEEIQKTGDDHKVIPPTPQAAVAAYEEQRKKKIKDNLEKGLISIIPFAWCSLKEMVPTKGNKLNSERTAFVTDDFQEGDSSSYYGPVLIVHGDTVNGVMGIGGRPTNEVINEIAREKGFKKLLVVACNPDAGKLGPTDIPVIYSTGIVQRGSETYTSYGRWRTSDGRSVEALAKEFDLGAESKPEETKDASETYNFIKDRTAIIKLLKERNWYYKTMSNSQKEAFERRVFDNLQDGVIEKIKELVVRKLKEEGLSIGPNSIISVMVFGSWCYASSDKPSDFDIAVVVRGIKENEIITGVKIEKTQAWFKDENRQVDKCDIKILSESELLKNPQDKDSKQLVEEAGIWGHCILLDGKDFMRGPPSNINILWKAKELLLAAEIHAMDTGNLKSAERRNTNLRKISRRWNEARNIIDTLSLPYVDDVEKLNIQIEDALAAEKPDFKNILSLLNQARKYLSLGVALTSIQVSASKVELKVNIVNVNEILTKLGAGQGESKNLVFSGTLFEEIGVLLPSIAARVNTRVAVVLTGDKAHKEAQRKAIQKLNESIPEAKQILFFEQNIPPIIKGNGFKYFKAEGEDTPSWIKGFASEVRTITQKIIQAIGEINKTLSDEIERFRDSIKSLIQA